MRILADEPAGRRPILCVSCVTQATARGGRYEPWSGSTDAVAPRLFTTGIEKGVPQVRIIHSLKSRRDREEGFTLIELMVVVLIIAILIAIAIPTFLGARERAQNSAAKSDLRNALAAAKVVYTDTEDYTDADAAALEAVEPSLTYVDGAGTVDAVGILAGATASNMVMVKVSRSGDTFCIEEDLSLGTYFGQTADCSDADPDGW
ncbi:MAG: prepilin-type N-terminal cleavage/methylation domain-containing protein [Actinomycetota bacterium]